MSIAKGREGRGPSLHGRYEALLADDGIRIVTEFRFADEVQCYLRLAPHRVERIAPQQKDGDRSGNAVTCGRQGPRLDCGAKGCAIEIDRSPDWLCPEAN